MNDNGAQAAFSVETFDCLNCNHVHILLKDANDRVFATATLSRECIGNIRYCQAVIDQRSRR